MSEEHSVPDYTITSPNKLTPIISLAKSFGSLDNCSNNFSLSFLTEDDAIKLEQIFEESFEIPESDSFNASSHGGMNDFIVNEIPVKKSQEQIIVQFDNLHSNDENVLCKDKDDSNNNEKNLSYDGKTLKYRQTNLEKKLNELKNKTIELQKKVNSQNKIILQQTMSQYEKHIENLSQLLKKLSSEEFDSILDEENRQIEKTQNFDEEKKFRRSMSASPPKLLPNSQDGYENTDPLTEIRNSPPVLRRVFFPSMIKCKSPSIIDSNGLNCEQSDKPTKNITNCSNLMIEPIYIKNENNDELLSPRRMIEIHDDECVEVTLLMKPMPDDETKDEKIVEDKIVNENSNNFIENLLMLKEQNSTDDENNDNQAQSIMDKEKPEESSLVIIEDISLDNQETIANNLDNYLEMKNLEMPTDFEKTKEAISNDKISDNPTQTNMFSSHDSIDYDSTRNFNNNSFKNLEVSLNPIAKPPPKVRSKKYTSKKAGQAKITISTQVGHRDDRNMVDPTSSNPNLLLTALPASCINDNNYHTQFNSLPSSTCLSKVYTAPSMHSGGNYSLTNVMNYQKDGNGNINEENLQMAAKNTVTEPIVLASHRSRAVNQSKSTVTQNPQTHIINNKISFNRPNPIDNNGMIEQFPTFGNWAANVSQRESSRNKKKLIAEPKTNVYSGTAMQNVEVTRSNYMIGNVAYIPRWNGERPPQPIIAESHPIQTNILPPRQRFLPAAPVPRILSGDYTIDPYAPVFSYNSAYPYGTNFSYAPFQPVAASPANISHPDKRLPNSPVFRNGADFVKIANPLPGTIAEKHPANLGADYVRAAAYNNYSIMMESQSARPIYKELTVNQHDETNLDQSSNQRKHAYDAYMQRVLREQQIVAASKTMRPRNESLQAINHEISTNPLATNVLTTSINSSAIYTTNSSRMQMKTSDSMGRSCPTPNMGKVVKNCNASSMRCYNCGTANAVFQCLGCETASYCNEICQAQHWNEHVLKCPKSMPKLKKVL